MLTRYRLVCGQSLETERDLASQLTLSRLENAVDRASCYRPTLALGEVYLREQEWAGIPTHIILDADSTDDSTQGQQVGSAYYGYYRQHFHSEQLDRFLITTQDVGEEALKEGLLAGRSP